MRVVLGFVLVIGALLSSTPPAEADSPGTLDVRVQDSGRPASGEAVRISGPVVHVERSGLDGHATFVDLPAGVYRVELAGTDYNGVHVDCEVVSGRTSIVTLARRALQHIGSVRASPGNLPSVGQDSAIRRLSESLVDALEKVAGVSIGADENGLKAVSIRNRESAQTGTSVDGVQLSNAAAAALRGVGTDFATGADVNYDADPSALGGSINFRTLSPTKTRRFLASGSVGSFDHTFGQVSATGSAGALSYAYQHAVRGSQSPLSGLTYEDQSGMSFPHDGSELKRSDLLKIRYGGQRSTLSFSSLSANARFSILCPRDLTNVACGTGPDNLRFNRFALESLDWSRNVGNVSVGLTLSSASGRNVYQDFDRLLDGTPVPLGSVFAFHDNTVSMRIATSGRRSDATMAASLSRENSAVVPTAGRLQYPQSLSQQRSRISIDDRVRLSPASSMTVGLTSFAITDASPTVQVSSGFASKVRGGVQYSLAASVGRGRDAVRSLQNWTDPSAAAVFANCSERSLSIGGPGTAVQDNSYNSFSFDVRKSTRLGSVKVGAYRQVQRGDGVSLAEPLLAVTDLQIPSGYLDALQKTWNDATVCAGTPFDPARLYVSRLTYGTTRSYGGLDVSVQRAIGRAVLLGNVSYSNTRLVSAPPNFAFPTSYYLAGRLLPGRATWRGNVTFDFDLGRGLEALLNAQYIGPNNGSFVAPYHLLTAGATRDFGRIRLTLLDVNVFGVRAPLFVHARDAVPVPLADAGSIRLVPAAVAPRQITLLVSVQLSAPSRR